MNAGLRVDTSRYKNIAVVGLGLIGASCAARIRQFDESIRVFGVDTDEVTLVKAVQNGWVTGASLPDGEAFESFVRNECELVILATPAKAARAYFEQLVSWGYSGIITDTASTKARICSDAADVLPDISRFIPGHPMAGSEVNGIEGARVDLFEGAHWIVCPNEDTPADDYLALHELLTGMGARVISLPREDHDRAIAIVSHVPHFVASSLVELAANHADDQKALFRLCAGGFKDSTRIAAGSPELWAGIAFDNKKALHDGLVEMSQIIARFITALEHDDRAELTALLDHSAKIRRSIPKKWLPDSENLLEVRIPMENRKGMVAEVTTIASKVGCNIQSIEIDHLTSSAAVLDMILTDEGDIGRLSIELLNAGFRVSLLPLSVKE